MTRLTPSFFSDKWRVYSVIPTPFCANTLMHIAIEEQADTIIINPFAGIPLRGQDSILTDIQRADKQGLPVFIMAGSVFERESLHIAKEAGAVLLDVRSNNYWGVHRALEAIIDSERRSSDKKNAAPHIKRRASETLHREFYKDNKFLELLLNSQIKDFADSLPENGPIVIDCGHIDSPDYYPTNSDQMTLEEGAVLFHYLQNKGHEVKIGILFNEVYMLEQAQTFYLDRMKGKSQARKDIRKLRKQSKREGMHQFLERAYKQILAGFGIEPDKYKDVFIPRFEGSLSLEARQDLQAYEQDRKHPFARELDELGMKGYSFQMDMPDDHGNTRSTERTLASADTGAPLCSLIFAKHNARYDRSGVERVIYLRDNRLRSSTLCGTRIARQIYGTQTNVDAFFYAERDERVALIEHQVITRSANAPTKNQTTS